MNQFEITDDKGYMEVMASKGIVDFATALSKYPCNRCSLCELDNHVVVYRGSPAAKIMLSGEAPGNVEHRTSSPFTGRAGEVLDKIFAYIGVDTNIDMYIGNIVKCRPVAQPGSGRENTTPKMSQAEACKPYALREIELIQPKILIACGLPAATALFKLGSKTRMKHVGGKFFNYEDSPMNNCECFIMYHPAAILHASGEPQKERELKQTTAEHMLVLRTKIDQLGIQLSSHREN